MEDAIEEPCRIVEIGPPLRTMSTPMHEVLDRLKFLHNGMLAVAKTFKPQDSDVLLSEATFYCQYTSGDLDGQQYTAGKRDGERFEISKEKLEGILKTTIEFLMNVTHYEMPNVYTQEEIRRDSRRMIMGLLGVIAILSGLTYLDMKHKADQKEKQAIMKNIEPNKKKEIRE